MMSARVTPEVLTSFKRAMGKHKDFEEFVAYALGVLANEEAELHDIFLKLRDDSIQALTSAAFFEKMRDHPEEAQKQIEQALNMHWIICANLKNIAERLKTSERQLEEDSAESARDLIDALRHAAKKPQQ